jgi:hypothetical protein
MKLKLRDFEDIPDIFYSGNEIELDSYKSQMDS